MDPSCWPGKMWKILELDVPLNRLMGRVKSMQKLFESAIEEASYFTFSASRKQQERMRGKSTLHRGRLTYPIEGWNLDLQEPQFRASKFACRNDLDVRHKVNSSRN